MNLLDQVELHILHFRWLFPSHAKRVLAVYSAKTDSIFSDVNVTTNLMPGRWSIHLKHGICIKVMHATVSDKGFGRLQVDQEVAMRSAPSTWLVVGADLNLARVSISWDSFKLDSDWLWFTNNDLVGSYGGCLMQQETCSERLNLLFHIV